MMVAVRFLKICICSALLAGCGFSGADFSPVAKDTSKAAFFAGSLAATSDAAVPKGVTYILRSPDGLFYTDALVNGVRVRFVVDSGSSLVVLSRKDADRAGVGAVRQRALHVRTASGTQRMPAVTVESLNIDGRPLDQVEAVIADDISGTSLLGQSALSRLDTVTFSGDRLQFR